MTVLGYSHKLIEMCSVEQVDLDTLFRDSDIISLHVPLTDSTRHLINAETFSKMKPDASSSTHHAVESLMKLR